MSPTTAELATRAASAEADRIEAKRIRELRATALDVLTELERIIGGPSADRMHEAQDTVDRVCALALRRRGDL